MSTLLDILVQDILPIFVVIGLGYAFARRARPELRTASRLTFYILSPCLVFVSLIESNINGAEIVQIAAFVVAMTIVMGLLALVTARLLHFGPRSTAGFLLAVMFVNAGNYGLGVTRLAFGTEAEARAVIYFVASSVLVYTLGVLIATGFAGGWRGTLKQLLSLPHVYALFAVFIIRAANWQVPQPIMAGLTFPAQAAIPMMLVLLGMQLANASIGESWKAASIGSLLRLVVGPIVAVVLAIPFALSGPARQAGILEASMPVAVINTIIAHEYEAEPQLVTSTVVISTLISPITLSIVIALLK